jgi:hypothetical protein
MPINNDLNSEDYFAGLSYAYFECDWCGILKKIPYGERKQQYKCSKCGEQMDRAQELELRDSRNQLAEGSGNYTRGMNGTKPMVLTEIKGMHKRDFKGE